MKKMRHFEKNAFVWLPIKAKALRYAPMKILHVTYTTTSRVVSIVGSLRDREVACSTSDRQG